jgi:hypothetical protein
VNRLKLTLRNIVIIIILFFIFVNNFGFYLTPLTAHEQSERSIHYGPSKVVHIEEYEDETYILGKYDKWVSCNTIKKQLFFFWSFGNQVTGFENDKSKDIDYSWNVSNKYIRLYGIRNNDNIEKVEFTLVNSDVFTATTFYDDLFLIIVKTPKNNMTYIKNIKGYDKDNHVIYEMSQ